MYKQQSTQTSFLKKNAKKCHSFKYNTKPSRQFHPSHKKALHFAQAKAPLTPCDSTLLRLCQGEHSLCSFHWRALRFACAKWSTSVQVKAVRCYPYAKSNTLLRICQEKALFCTLENGSKAFRLNLIILYLLMPRTLITCGKIEHIASSCRGQILCQYLPYHYNLCQEGTLHCTSTKWEDFTGFVLSVTTLYYTCYGVYRQGNIFTSFSLILVQAIGQTSQRAVCTIWQSVRCSQ